MNHLRIDPLASIKGFIGTYGLQQSIAQSIRKRGGNESLIDEKYDSIGNYKMYIGDVIGQGSYGKVFKARRNDSSQLLACKIISKAKLENLKLYSIEYAEQLQKRFRTESEFHQQLSGCSNIVKLVQTIQNSKAYYFIMEYCETDLSKVIREKGILGEEVALKYFSEMLEGYKSIYEKNAFHRDLKPENLLLRDNVVKISDFGFVKIFTDMDSQCKSGKNKLRTESKVGSIKYMAPDVLSLSMWDSQGKTYNAEKSDIWSMGIILYKMLYGKEPFNGNDEEQMITKINEKQLRFPDTVELSPEIIRNTKVTPETKKLLRKMIDKDQSSRVTFKKLYSSVRSLMRERQNEKLMTSMREEGEGKEKGEAKNKKEELLIVYNKLIVKMYHDAVNYATLREIGLDNYYETTCKLMTLVHEKRTLYIQNDEKGEEEEVNEKIKQEISSYHNTFWTAIKNIGYGTKDTKEETLSGLLLPIYTKIKEYTEFDQLMKEVQIYLIDLLLLLSLELHIVKSDYAYTWSLRSEHYKQKLILNYNQNTLTMLDRKLNNDNEKESRKHKRDKTREKDQHRSREGREKGRSKSRKKQPSEDKPMTKSTDYLLKKKEPLQPPKINQSQQIPREISPDPINCPLSEEIQSK